MPLTPPAQRLQPALSSKERSALRTEAERMVAANKMVVMQVRQAVDRGPCAPRTEWAASRFVPCGRLRRRPAHAQNHLPPCPKPTHPSLRSFSSAPRA